MKRLWIFLLLTGSVWAQSAPELDRLLEEEWQALMRFEPVVATYVGEPVAQDRWADLSAEARRGRAAHYQKLLQRLNALDQSGWGAGDRENFQLFKLQIGWLVKSDELGLDLLALNHRDGIQTIASLTEGMSFEKPSDYQNWIARLEAMPLYTEQTIEVLRQGIQRKIMQPRVIVSRLPRQIQAQLVEDPKESPFYKPFKNCDDAALCARAEKAILQRVQPAYRKLLHFIEQEYLPASPEQIGALHWPDGQRAYQFLVERYTTTKMSADEVHHLGLSEVARIRAEMQKVKAQTGFQGDFKGFLAFLRNDSRFYYQDSQQLLRHYRAFSKQVDEQMPRFFGRLPRRPYGVRPIPDYVAPDTTTAYYLPPTPGQPGVYYVNLYRPESRPTYEIEVLTLHEAVPGHHHQIALALELDDLPKFRRFTDGFGGYTVFVEGWGLYSESLGEEMGFYQDPYSKFGQLTYEMWRAVRLVVDTGMHSKGWTRQQAIDFFLENTAKTRLDIENEVDRYIAWPGQALAYKIGELKIKELRRRAEQALGAKFDIREFHDKVLESGAIPLDLLEQKIEDYIAKKR